MAGASVSRFAVSAGDEMVLSAASLLGKNGDLVDVTVRADDLERFPSTYEEEETLFSENPGHARKTGDYRIVRDKIRDQLRLAVAYVNTRLGVVLPRQHGLDIGSGSTGEMINLLPDPIDRDSWVLSDVNSDSVACLGDTFPNNRVYKASYLNLHRDLNLRNSLSGIVGLSSLDSTIFVERAIEQIRDALVTGGIFFHMQDLTPDKNIAIRELFERGVYPPFKGKARRDTGEVLLYNIDGKWVDVIDLFRAQLVMAVLKVDGMELLFDKYVFVEELLGSTVTSTGGSAIYTPGVALTVDSSTELGAIINSHVATHVLVARKKA